MRLGEHPDMEKALMTWFVQQRNQNIPISTEMIQHKAKYFYNQITGKNDFGPSLGWISNFKARHGIRKLKICGEKVSSDVSAVEPFRQKLKSIIKEIDLDHDQIYNADESAAFWKVIPANTLAHSQEKSASGRKISKDRITFMPCCNASGTHKLPLLVIGKSTNPRSFKNCNVPVTYKATKKGWMSTFLFTEWYRKYFIPDVKKFLQDNNRPLKAILLIGNAPCHPRSEDIDIDTNFRIVFLPPNCTAIIQPLDQNLIQNVKVSYRKQLLNYLPIDNTDIGIALKNFTLRNCVTLLNNAWLGISQQNIVRSWNQLLCSDRQEWMEEDLIPLAQLTAANSDMNEIHTIIASTNLDAQVDTQTINDWATGRDFFFFVFFNISFYLQSVV
ncbi:tigger transposable element-derived protein 2-like [Bactrocera dorsalis]|uniref:Tigger transposable element-derived protein 2-like n=1 Tax=Bactrocera dorsalis TaxID=27457 RepID=A0ABM3JA25_BACDO|nr:tigger transposable element-derived protein 2-like [Bactrocera dorsalis]